MLTATMANASELKGHNQILGKTLKCTFAYDPTLVEKVKSLKGREYSKKEKFWLVPITRYSLKKLQDWGFTIPQIQENRNTEDIVGFQGLRPYQIEGVQFIENNHGRGLIGDPMGLGKTLQALGYLGLRTEKRPALIIMPASIKIKWAREIAKWMPSEKVQIIEGKKEVEITGDIVLANWDIIFNSTKYIDPDGKTKIKTVGRKEFVEAGFQVVIGDEVHKVSNGKAARTKAFKHICKTSPCVIGLSGTPIKNKPIDFFNILNILDPVQFKSYWKFAHKYCDAKRTNFGWDFSGASNLDILHKAIQKIMIRREKEDVTDLPPKTRIVIPIPLKNKNSYKRLEKELRDMASGRNAPPAAQLTLIEKLKQLSVQSKLKGCIEWMHDFLEEEEKLVVFCVHKNVVQELLQELKQYNPVIIVGGMNAQEKDDAAQTFQTDKKCRIFIGNIDAACEGIDLYAAHSTCTIELKWGPTIHDQAEDRVYRIGQTADHVYAYYLLGLDTIEENLAELIDHKRTIIDQTIDGKETEKKSLLVELMEKYRKMT